jgi:simple sugar transport system ATP-binding protein
MISNYEGKVTFSNHEIKPEDSPLTRRQAGLGHIPEDRQTMGAALGATLTENFIMGGLSDPAYTSPGVISYTRAGDVAKRQYENFDVKYASLNEPAGALSGGNLQKAIVAREIYRDPQILIAAQPSRGVDIGATLFIHRELIKLRECGKAILLVSGELSEVMSLSDRVIVLYNGAIVGEVDPKKSTEEEIGLLMAGMKGGTAS